MPKILVVDDEKNIVKILERFLVLKGFEVSTALEGGEAIKIITSQNDIGLIILDMRMPPKTGIDILKELSQKNIKIPAIILSGDLRVSEEINELEKIGYGDTDILLKPVDLNELLACLQKKLSSVS